jgi:hypothetical protein
LRRGLAQVRAPAIAAAGFGLLRTPFGRAAAGRILFGDGSFPSAVRPEPGASCPVPGAAEAVGR